MSCVTHHIVYYASYRVCIICNFFRILQIPKTFLTLIQFFTFDDTMGVQRAIAAVCHRHTIMISDSDSDSRKQAVIGSVAQETPQLQS